ncbi:hypothetical protein D7Y23_37790 [Corallococcus sp. AB050B]|nr:hypothetical protein D7Y23_37790 [Corallococcus sp. AB050B]
MDADAFENAFALLLDGRGGARSLTLEETRSWRASDGMLWVHLPPDLPDLPRVLEADFRLPPRVREPLLADTGRVRIEVLNEDELVLLLLHPDTAPTDAASARQLRAWMTADRCVTVAPSGQHAIASVRVQLAHGLTGLLGVNLGGIPGAQWRGSFLLLVLVLIALAAAEWRALRRRELV